MPTPLNAKRRSELRAEAHKLTPVVIIGDKGLTDEVVAEIDRSLKAHELIKVRAFTDDRKARGEWLEAICGRLEAHAVQQIGKMFVLYRENPKEAPPKRKPPAAAAPEPEVRARKPREPRDFKREPDAGSRRKPDDREVKGTSRPRSRAPSPPQESEPRRRRRNTSQ